MDVKRSITVISLITLGICCILAAFEDGETAKDTVLICSGIIFLIFGGFVGAIESA